MRKRTAEGKMLLPPSGNGRAYGLPASKRYTGL
jgi:hypothetical protein